MKYLVNESGKLEFRDDAMIPSNFVCRVPESFTADMVQFTRVERNLTGECYPVTDMIAFAYWRDQRLAEYNSAMLKYKNKKDLRDMPLTKRVYRGIFGSFVETIVLGLFKNHLKKLFEAVEGRLKR